jgi:hypothetical protein
MSLKKVYIDEWNQYPDMLARRVSQEDARKITHKLWRHFDIPEGMRNLNFTTHRNGAAYSSSICLPSSGLISLDLIAHEVAHHLARVKYGDTVHHNKKFKRCRDRIFRYVIKKNYFSDQFPITIDISVKDKILSSNIRYSIKQEERKERKRLREDNKNIPSEVNEIIKKSIENENEL